MVHVVAIAGGSGGLGRALVDALKKDDGYKTLVLARKANPDLQAEIGVPIIEADYSSQEALVQLLEAYKVDTVISTITPPKLDQTSEINLIKAADQASTTKRFIPSEWSGFVYTPEHAKVSPVAASKLSLRDTLQTTSLEWTTIYPGIFLDFYALTLPSYVPKSALAIDIVANAAAIPGDGKYTMPFTHTVDIAKYVVAALGLKEWERKYFIVGDTKSWNEFVPIAEAAKGAKFSVVYDEIEKLQKGELTELPGQRILYDRFGGEAARPMFHKMLAPLAVWMAEGQMVYDGPFLNEIFPNIKPVTVEQALGKAE